MFTPRVGGVGSLILVLVLVNSAGGGFSAKQELAKLAGTWESGPVSDADGQGSGIVKLTMTAAGRAELEISAKRGGSSSSSKRSFSFSVVQKGTETYIFAPGPAGTGVQLSYRLDDGKLILTGPVVSRRTSYNLKDVAMNKAEKK